MQLIKNTAELVIVRHHGASTEDIYNDLVPKLLENGLLGVLKQKVSDGRAHCRQPPGAPARASPTA